jgi:uncharacterized membrane protein YeaQ/YmgE (transglycosylase-associated protein family)
VPHRPILCLVLGTVAALIATAIDPVVAAAAADAGQVGQNLGSLLKSWIVPLFGAVAGLVALPYLAKRDVAGAMVFVLLAMIVGAFVFAPAQLRTFIGDFWKTVLG